MMQPIYMLRDVTKSYAGRCVLRVADLTIYAGEVIALVGPSGAGKSTLLRLLNFLELPTTGELYFVPYQQNGCLPPLEARRQITTVFQRPILLQRTVAENVSYGLQIRGESNARARVAHILQGLGLTHLADAPAYTLSGGEAHRVALARALVVQPAVLLLDEATANLDPYNVKLIEAIVADTNQQQGTTVVLVTHNIFQARRLAQRVGFLLDGYLVEVAPTETFFENPADQRARAFVRGDMIY